MPSISIPTAIIGSTVIGGATSLIAGSNTASAAKDTAAANNAQALAIYNQNKGLETPFINTGQTANSAEANLLGLGGSGAGSGGYSGGGAGTGLPSNFSGSSTTNADWNAYLQQNPDVAQYFTAHQSELAAQGITTPQQWAEAHYVANGKTEGRALPTVGNAPQSQVDPTLSTFAQKVGTAPELAAISSTIGSSLPQYLDNTGQAKPTQQIADQIGNSFADYTANSGVGKDMAANDQLLGLGGGGYSDYLKNSGLSTTNDAISHFLGLDAGGAGLDSFLKSTGYNFQLDQGTAAVQRSNAAKGLLTSGATAKDLTQYGQDLAKSYGQTYLNALGQYGTQREGQATNYSQLVGSQTARQQGLNVDYQNALGGLGNMRRQQALDFTGQQSGLAGLNTNNFNTYFGATNDVANRGLSATNALAGVGTNLVSQTTANNNNALQAQAGANANTANTINSTLNNALGAFSYLKQPSTSAAITPASAWGGYSSAYQGG